MKSEERSWLSLLLRSPTVGRGIDARVQHSRRYVRQDNDRVSEAIQKVPGQRDLHVGRMAYRSVGEGAGRQVLALSEKGLRAMAVFKIPVHDADAQHGVHAAAAEEEVPAGTGHQRHHERAVGEDTQAVVGAVLRRHPGVG